MVSQAHKDALDDACVRAKGGERSQQVFGDDAITIKITGHGGVQVTVMDGSFNNYSKEGRMRSVTRDVTVTKPVFADPSFAFKPK